MSNQFGSGPKVGIIAGTGFESVLSSAAYTVDVETPYGTVPLSGLPVDGGSLIFAARHGAGHAMPPHQINFHALIWSMRSAGVVALLATAASGSLRLDLTPGAIVILDDFIDFRGLCTTFYVGAESTVRHTDFSEPFSSAVRKALVSTIRRLKDGYPPALEVHETGTYLCVAGPRYETPAEVRLFSRWGADVVGMTVAPEAVLAKELGIPYGAVAVATNYGTGLTPSALSHEDVCAQMDVSRAYLLDLLTNTGCMLLKQATG